MATGAKVKAAANIGNFKVDAGAALTSTGRAAAAEAVSNPSFKKVLPVLLAWMVLLMSISKTCPASAPPQASPIEFSIGSCVVGVPDEASSTTSGTITSSGALASIRPMTASFKYKALGFFLPSEPNAIPVIATEGSPNDTVRLWNAMTGRNLAVLQGHRGRVLSATFSDDGSKVITAGIDHDVRVWDVATGQLLTLLRSGVTPVSMAALSHDGTRAATGDIDGTVRLWDIARASVTATLSGHTGEVSAIVFSPDDKTLVTGSVDTTVRGWSVGQGRALDAIASGHHAVESLAYSPDGKLLAAGYYGESTVLWHTQSRVLFGEFVTVKEGYGLAFSPDARRLAISSGDGTVTIWDIVEQREIGVIRQRSLPAFTMAFSQDGVYLLAGGHDAVTSKWSLVDDRLSTTYDGSKNWVRTAAISLNGSHVITASGALTPWNPTTVGLLYNAEQRGPPILITPRSGQLTNIVFRPNGSSFAEMNGRSAEIRGEKNELIRRSPFAATEVKDLTFSQSGNTLAVLAGGFAYLWQVERSDEVDILAPVEGTVTSFGRTIKHTYRPDQPIIFSFDGTRVVTGSSDYDALIWDVSTHALASVLTGATGKILSADISTDGRKVVTGTSDGTVIVWNVSTGRPEVTLTGSRAGQILRVAFSPDADRVAIVSESLPVRVWTISDGDHADEVILSDKALTIGGVGWSQEGQLVTVVCRNIN